MIGEREVSPVETGAVASTVDNALFARALVALTAALAAGTLILLVSPVHPLAVVAPFADVALNTTATVGALAVAVLGWLRYVLRRRTTDLLIGAALLPLALIGAIAVLAPTLGMVGALHMSADVPSQVPVYVGTAYRSVSAAVFAVVVAVEMPPIASTRRAFLVFVAPTITAALIGLVLTLVGDRLPPLVDPTAVEALARAPGVATVMPARTLLGLAWETGITLTLLAGLVAVAAASPPRRIARARTRPWLVVALVIGTIAQVHALLYPGAFAGIVTSADVVRLGVVAVLLVGLARELLRDMTELETRARLAPIEAVGEERARVARDLHDGTAQQLWRARLTLGLLLENHRLRGRDVQLATDAVSAVTAAMDSARQTLTGLRATAVEVDLAAALASRVAWLDRDARPAVRLSLAGDIPPLSPRTATEILRIVDEAMTNAARHADASAITVAAATDGPLLSVLVCDDGRGFDPHGTHGGIGLESMRDRARAIGGELSIDTRVGAGTFVTLRVPIDAGG